MGFSGANSPQTASFFKQLVWNPAEFEQSGTSVTRTFVLRTDGDAADNNRVIDGFEIYGQALFIYDIPEPSSAVLIVCGASIVWLRRRASRPLLSRQ